MSIILAVLAIIIMIIIHEWGHFIAGRICKIPIYEFSIGFGPSIWHHKGKKETVFSIRAIPLGGFCSFDDPETLKNAAENGVTDMALDMISIPKRIFICAAGPLMNIFTCLLICASIYAFVGIQVPTTQIINFQEDNVVENILQINDTVYSISDINVYNKPDDLSSAIQSEMKKNGKISITVLRNNKYFTYENIVPIKNPDTNLYSIGIYEKSAYQKVPLKNVAFLSIDTTWEYSKAIISSLGRLITGKVKAKQVSGIVGTVALMGEYATASTIVPFLSLCALISANLGIMNLLPIPALDGSKILFGILEAIRRKPLNKNFEIKLTMIGFTILIGLSVILILMDVVKLVV